MSFKCHWLYTLRVTGSQTLELLGAEKKNKIQHGVTNFFFFKYINNQSKQMKQSKINQPTPNLLANLYYKIVTILTPKWQSCLSILKNINNNNLQDMSLCHSWATKPTFTHLRVKSHLRIFQLHWSRTRYQ